MGLTLSFESLAQMEREMDEQRPTLGPDADYRAAPLVQSISAGGSTFAFLLSARLQDGAVPTVMLNPVVARSLGQLILIANEERDWGGEDAAFNELRAYSRAQRQTLERIVVKRPPPAPSEREFETAMQIVSLFGGSNEAGLLLNLRAKDGAVVTWMLNPVVAFHLLGLILTCGEKAAWWDEQCRFVLSGPDA